MEKETVQKLNSNQKQVLVVYLIASFWQLNWRLIKQRTIQVFTNIFYCFINMFFLYKHILLLYDIFLPTVVQNHLT